MISRVLITAPNRRSQFANPVRFESWRQRATRLPAVCFSLVFGIRETVDNFLQCICNLYAFQNHARKAKTVCRLRHNMEPWVLKQQQKVFRCLELKNLFESSASSYFGILPEEGAKSFPRRALVHTYVSHTAAGSHTAVEYHRNFWRTRAWKGVCLSLNKPCIHDLQQQQALRSEGARGLCLWFTDYPTCPRRATCDSPQLQLRRRNLKWVRQRWTDMPGVRISSALGDSREFKQRRFIFKLQTSFQTSEITFWRLDFDLCVTVTVWNIFIWGIYQVKFRCFSTHLLQN